MNERSMLPMIVQITKQIQQYWSKLQIVLLMVCGTILLSSGLVTIVSQGQTSKYPSNNSSTSLSQLQAIYYVDNDSNDTLISMISDYKHNLLDSRKCGQLYLTKLFTALYKNQNVQTHSQSAEVFIAAYGELEGGDKNRLNAIHGNLVPCHHNLSNTQIGHQIMNSFKEMMKENKTSATSILYIIMNNSPTQFYNKNEFHLNQNIGRISQKSFYFLNNQHKTFRILYDISFPAITPSTFEQVHQNMIKIYQNDSFINSVFEWYKYNISFQGSARSYFPFVLLKKNHKYHNRLHANLRQVLFQYFCNPEYVDQYGIVYSLKKDTKTKGYPIATCDIKAGNKNCNLDTKYQYDYLELMMRSHFCFVISGHNVFSYRLMEVLASSCIPVIINSGWVLPFNQIIDWTKYCVFINEQYFFEEYETIDKFLNKYFLSSQSIVQILLENNYNGKMYYWHQAILSLYQEHFSTPAKRVNSLIKIIQWQRKNIDQQFKIDTDNMRIVSVSKDD